MIKGVNFENIGSPNKAKTCRNNQKIKTAPDSPISYSPKFPSPDDRCISALNINEGQNKVMSKSFLVSSDARTQKLLCTSETNETSCGDPTGSHEQFPTYG